jgi:hypothetical protein
VGADGLRRYQGGSVDRNGDGASAEVEREHVGELKQVREFDERLRERDLPLELFLHGFFLACEARETIDDVAGVDFHLDAHARNAGEVGAHDVLADGADSTGSLDGASPGGERIVERDLHEVLRTSICGERRVTL